MHAKCALAKRVCCMITQDSEVVSEQGNCGTDTVCNLGLVLLMQYVI